MIEKLFVYGTLGLGRPNEHILNNIGGTWEVATVTGNLKDEGWGSEMGYPAICLDDNGEEVEGFIFSSNNLSNNWDKLDKFEGEAYHRVSTNAKLKNKNMTEVYIYTLRSKD
ncbi:MAG: gamma-glutamylcyclotransferase family protein [Arcobacteraceae bacterium]